jgi:hypothetical protein
MSVKVRLLLLTLALTGVGGSYWHYLQNVSRLDAAAQNLRHCEIIAEKIADARQTPQRVRLQSWSQDDLGTAVEKAATAAQLARDRLLRIDPQPAKRIGKTDYLDQATEVELAGVTLRQLVDFIYEITHSDDQLDAATLRLRAPHDLTNNPGQELWLADVVLTQRIFAPIAPAK